VAELPRERAPATALFRICQESLANVARHAQATQVRIQLHEEAGGLVLTVTDNGRGITAQAVAAPTSLGLLRMRERALLLGGEFSVAGRPDTGTSVRVRLPMERPGGASLPS
jgi:signal transduction histidine kinase